MKTYVLDSSALLRYLDGEAGAGRVEEILKECVRGVIEARISALQWGEIAGNLYRRLKATEAREILNHLLPSEVEIVSANADRAMRAACLKVAHGIGYADAFALDLAMDTQDNALLTADYGFKVVEKLAQIEFLPAK